MTQSRAPATTEQSHRSQASAGQARQARRYTLVANSYSTAPEQHALSLSHNVAAPQWARVDCSATRCTRRYGAEALRTPQAEQNRHSLHRARGLQTASHHSPRRNCTSYPAVLASAHHRRLAYCYPAMGAFLMLSSLNPILGQPSLVTTTAVNPQHRLALTLHRTRQTTANGTLGTTTAPAEAKATATAARHLLRPRSITTPTRRTALWHTLQGTDQKTNFHSNSTYSTIGESGFTPSSAKARVPSATLGANRGWSRTAGQRSRVHRHLSEADDGGTVVVLVRSWTSLLGFDSPA